VKHAIGEAKDKPVASPRQVSAFRRSDITAPPKPSAQTKILLDQMSRSQEDDKTKWDQVMDNFDLLFTRMNDIGIIQQDLKNQLTANNLMIDNCTKEQQFIAQQVKANGQAVGQLTLRQFEDEKSDSSVSIVFEEENPFATDYGKDKGASKPSTSKQPRHFLEPNRKEGLPHHAL